jgi:hypothetical protein
VTAKERTVLPVLGQPADEAEAASTCSPNGYVSNEELVLLRAMSELRDRALNIRSRLESAHDGERRLLESELEELRDQRRELIRRRDQAFIRKMVMLGHLPPQALDDLRES